jgi:hypothetical protein
VQSSKSESIVSPTNRLHLVLPQFRGGAVLRGEVAVADGHAVEEERELILPERLAAVALADRQRQSSARRAPELGEGAGDERFELLRGDALREFEVVDPHDGEGGVVGDFGLLAGDTRGRQQGDGQEGGERCGAAHHCGGSPTESTGARPPSRPAF